MVAKGSLNWMRPGPASGAWAFVQGPMPSLRCCPASLLPIPGTGSPPLLGHVACRMLRWGWCEFVFPGLLSLEELEWALSAFYAVTLQLSCGCLSSSRESCISLVVCHFLHQGPGLLRGACELKEYGFALGL